MGNLNFGELLRWGFLKFGRLEGLHFFCHFCSTFFKKIKARNIWNKRKKKKYRLFHKYWHILNNSNIAKKISRSPGNNCFSLDKKNIKPNENVVHGWHIYTDLRCLLAHWTHAYTNFFSDCIGESGKGVIGLAAKPGLKENIKRQLHCLCCREIEEFQLKWRKVVVNSSTLMCSLIDESLPDERLN